MGSGVTKDAPSNPGFILPEKLYSTFHKPIKMIDDENLDFQLFMNQSHSCIGKG